MDPILRQMALQQQMQNSGDMQEMPHPSYMEFMRNNNAPPSQQQVAPEENSPINKGTLSAIKAARHSLGMDEEEKRRAMGLAIMKFFSNMAKPGHGPGFAGALGAVNDSFNPAVEAYMNERNRIETLNASLMKQMMDAENAARERDFRERGLTEQIRHHKRSEEISGIDSAVSKQLKELQLREGLEKEHMVNEARAQDKKIKEASGDAVKSILSMPYSTQLMAEKQGESFQKRATASQEVLEAAETMKEIVKKNPKILSNWKQVQMLKASAEPSLVQNAIQNMTLSESDKTDLFTLWNAKKTMFVKSLEGIPAKALNMRVDSFLESSLPGAQMTEGAFLKTLNPIINQFSHSYQENSKGANYFEQGKLYRLKPYQRHHNYSQARMNEEGTKNSPSGELSNMTMEQLKAEEARLAAGVK